MHKALNSILKVKTKMIVRTFMNIYEFSLIEVKIIKLNTASLIKFKLILYIIIIYFMHVKKINYCNFITK